MRFKKIKVLKWLLSTLLLFCTLQQPLYAGQVKNYSIGKTNPKNKDSFILWGNLSGDTTSLATFLSYDSLALQPDHPSCEQAAIAGFDLIILYQDTAVLSFKLKNNKITDEIKHRINKLPNVNRIIIESIRLACTVKGKESIRHSKFVATYTIIQD